MRARLLGAACALLGGVWAAADLLAHPSHEPEPEQEGEPGPLDPRGHCPVCEAPVDLAAGPHEHDDGLGWCAVWPTDTPGAVLVTDPDGAHPAVWAS